MTYLMGTLLSIVSVLLMFIILLQRGRGGGLAGAFGGMGGQSAFGTKAGDVFTKITVGLAVIWVLLAGINIRVLQSGATSAVEKSLRSEDQKQDAQSSSPDGDGQAPPVSTAPAESGNTPKTSNDPLSLPPASTSPGTSDEDSGPSLTPPATDTKTPAEAKTPAADAETSAGTNSPADAKADSKSNAAENPESPAPQVGDSKSGE